MEEEQLLKLSLGRLRSLVHLTLPFPQVVHLDISNYSMLLTISIIQTVESEFDSFKSTNSVFAIGLFKSLESEVALTFIATAQEDERTIFAISSSEELFTKLGKLIDLSLYSNKI